MSDTLTPAHLCHLCGTPVTELAGMLVCDCYEVALADVSCAHCDYPAEWREHRTDDHRMRPGSEWVVGWVPGMSLIVIPPPIEKRSVHVPAASPTVG